MGQVLFAVSIVVMGACTRNSPDVIPLSPPPNPPLSRPVIGYGVISASYTHVAAQPGEEGVSLGYLRKSSIVEVLERRPVNKAETVEIWVLVEGTYRGWLKEEVIQIYESEAQARTATEFLSP